MQKRCGLPADRRRGRPRAFDREVALARATAVFWRKGYEATSIVDLTAAMGIGSPSLYAAFGSKDALYREAVRHYGEQHEGAVWDRFRAAPTARGAVEAYLLDSAAGLCGGACGKPAGCMVTLSAGALADHAELDAELRGVRGEMLARVEARLRVAVAAGELPATVDVAGLARFVQAVQGGMSILARDGAGRTELEAAARTAMMGWDVRVALKPA